jgi:hypothetical protein
MTSQSGISVTRQHVCSPARVARYTGKQQPKCNRGLGCPACWDKYLDVQSPLPGQFPDACRVELYLESLVKADINVPAGVLAAGLRLAEREQEEEYAARKDQRPKR